MADFAPRVRWDRVGRVALLFVGLLMLYLYVSPVTTFISTWQEAGRKREDVRVMQREHEKLVARRHGLTAPGAIETEARRLGMVRKDEQAYVVHGLPRGK
jgi:cell division protein FtsB